MGFWKGIKKVFNIGEKESIILSAPVAPPGQLPTERSIYQSRQNFGVNFGSLFVLEKYIFDEMFIDDSRTELDAIKNYIKKNGVSETRNRLQKHWMNFCSDDDWLWLKENGIQSVRIPIGYWMVAGGKFTKGTSFDKISEVYANAWAILKEHYIEKAKNYQISILVDLHALPKGANTDAHSGQLFKAAGFWNSNHAIDLAVSICSFIANDVKDYDNVCGLQIVNESEFTQTPVGQERYYTKAINAIRKVNVDIPIVISDGWCVNQWVAFLDRLSGGNIGSLGVVIDDHVYRCFTEAEKRSIPLQIIYDLNITILTDLSKEADCIVGEYSCVLDEQTWFNSRDCDRSQMTRAFGHTQTDIFKERARTGYYFWTYKFQHGDGGEWGLRPMITHGCIPPRSNDCPLPSQEDYDRIFQEAYRNHTYYWNGRRNNENPEFWRYKAGFEVGWNDALSFAKLNNSKIGRDIAWLHSRRQEHINAKGTSAFLWEWDVGFKEAIKKFNDFCG